MPVDLRDLEVSSKTQTPEQINEVLSGLGYSVDKVEEATTQATPDEVESAAEADRIAVETAATEAAEATQQAEETERKSRNQRRKEARERSEQALRDATEKSNRLEREFADFQTKTAAELADLRKNPPKAEVEPPLPEAPKRPTRGEFLQSEDPDAAYEDALLDFADKRREHRQLLTERAKPKEQPKADPVPAQAAPPARQPTYSDDEINAVDPAKVEGTPELKRFMGSVKSVTGIHPGAYKAIVENIPNVNDAIIRAGHTFDEPARIALYLAKHPDESKRIKALTDGNVAEDPRKVRIAVRELEKIEALAAAEDRKAAGGSGDEDDTEVDPDEEHAPATPVAAQPPRTETPAKPAQAATTAPATPQQQPKKKATPIDPVGARGSQAAKRYEEMTMAEQKATPIEEVRRMRGML